MNMRIFGLGVALVLISASCGGDLDDTATLDTTAGGEVVAAPTEERSVSAKLSEWKIEVPSDTVAAGRYTFRVQNTGQYAHALEVEGQGEERETDRLAPAGSDELTVELRPGQYELYCPVEDAHGKHRELGMRRTLVVR